MRKVLFSLGLLVLAATNITYVEARTKTIEGTSYMYQKYHKGTVWITNIGLENAGQTLKIPTYINGAKVVKLGALSDDGYNDVDAYSIFGFHIDNESGKLTKNRLYKKLSKIKKIVVPETVEVCVLHALQERC